MNGSTAVADQHATIEALHAEVCRAAERCHGMFVSKASRMRLADALAAEREALAELGFDSYSAYMFSTAEAHDGTWTPDQLLFLAGVAGDTSTGDSSGGDPDSGDIVSGDMDLEIDARDRDHFAELAALNDDEPEGGGVLDARFAAAHDAARDLTCAIAAARREANAARAGIVAELREVAARLDALAGEAAALADEFAA